MLKNDISIIFPCIALKSKGMDMLSTVPSTEKFTMHFLKCL